MRGILSNAGAKIGTTVGDKVSEVLTPKKDVPVPPWSWNLPHNIAVALTAQVCFDGKWTEIQNHAIKDR